MKTAVQYLPFQNKISVTFKIFAQVKIHENLSIISTISKIKFYYVNRLSTDKVQPGHLFKKAVH